MFSNFYVDFGAVTGYSDADVQLYIRGGYKFNDHISLFVAPGTENDDVGLVTGLEYTF